MAIEYRKLFALLEARHMSIYKLKADKVIGTATLDKIRKGNGHIDTRSIENLCAYLSCQPGDLMEYVPDENNQA
jgi:Predicted transcriptional regulator